MLQNYQCPSCNTCQPLLIVPDGFRCATCGKNISELEVLINDIIRLTYLTLDWLDAPPVDDTEHPALEDLQTLSMMIIGQNIDRAVEFCDRLLDDPNLPDDVNGAIMVGKALALCADGRYPKVPSTLELSGQKVTLEVLQESLLQRQESRLQLITGLMVQGMKSFPPNAVRTLSCRLFTLVHLIAGVAHLQLLETMQQFPLLASARVYTSQINRISDLCTPVDLVTNDLNIIPEVDDCGFQNDLIEEFLEFQVEEEEEEELQKVSDLDARWNTFFDIQALNTGVKLWRAAREYYEAGHPDAVRTLLNGYDASFALLSLPWPPYWTSQEDLKKLARQTLADTAMLRISACSFLRHEVQCNPEFASAMAPNALTSIEQNLALAKNTLNEMNKEGWLAPPEMDS